MASLIFIDTNIYLDFYRVIGRQGGLSILERIDDNHERLITTSQVEMEFKKNRPGVILESYRGLKPPDWSGLRLPAYLARSKQSSGLDTGRSKIEDQLSTLRNRIENVFREPTRFDPVYKVAQRVFRSRTDLSMHRDYPGRDTIRRLAYKRFALGYPPRKPGDTAVGDGINWEWIVRCAKRTTKDVVIVSRDSDYGVQFAKGVYINDWLLQEFRERVGRRKSVVLTDRLSEGFRMASIPVTKKEEAAEQEFLDQRAKSTAESALASWSRFGTLLRDAQATETQKISELSQAVLRLLQMYQQPPRVLPKQSDGE